MGAGQVLRAAGVAAGLLLLCGPASGKTPAADLRPIDAALPEGLDEIDFRRVLVHRTMAEIDRGCGHATAAVTAILSYEDPDRSRPLLERALAAELVCADAKNDPAKARLGATLLRNLRGDEGIPAGVPEDVWKRYPGVDATTNVFAAPVTVTTDAPARVWIDLVPRDGESVLSPGPHLVVAAIPGRKRVVTIVKVAEKKAQTFHFEPVEDTELHAKLDAWRAAGGFPADAEVAAMNATGPLVVVVADRVRVYDGGKRVAEGNHAELAALLAPKPAPAQAVAPPVEEPRKRGRSWWIYAAAVGAVVVGAAFVYALDSGENVQRIEVRWP